jgi:hypothetical protein
MFAKIPDWLFYLGIGAASGIYAALALWVVLV